MARVPGLVRLATAVSMPDVPVPETAKENAPASVRNVSASRERISSRIAIIAGSRWLSTGAAIARMMRSATGLGPGPSSRRSAACGIRGIDACGIEQAPDLLHAFARQRRERRAWLATGEAAQVHGGLQAGDAEAAGDGAGERRQPLLAVERLREASLPRVLEQLEAQLGRDAGDGENGPLRTRAQRGVDPRRGSRHHGEARGHRGREVRELRAVGAGFLEA